MYIKYKNQIYKVTDICMCENCRKGEMPGLIIMSPKTLLCNYIELSDLFSGEYELSNNLEFNKIITHKDVSGFLQKQTDTEWLTALNRWINSHINFLKSMEELEKHCERR